MDLISNMNYPSIAISKLDIVKGSKTISRGVTNLSPDHASTYKVSIVAPVVLNVKVSPQTLQFFETSTTLAMARLELNGIYGNATTCCRDPLWSNIPWNSLSKRHMKEYLNGSKENYTKILLVYSSLLNGNVTYRLRNIIEGTSALDWYTRN